MAQVTDQAGRPAAEVVQSLHPLDSRPSPLRGAANHAVMDQRNRRFVPHVLVVQNGTAVAFPNSDEIRYHVYSFSAPKRFELPLYKGTPAKPVRFDRPGVVVLGSNIHNWMLGYIYVADTPYFGTTNADGSLRIESLPAGDYRVQLSHPQASSQGPNTMEVVQIRAAGHSKRVYALELTGGPGDTGPVPPADSVEDKFKRSRG